MDTISAKYLIVGAGIFGLTVAERIANDLQEKVVVIDKRPHIGGNCYSEVNQATGIEVHKYGAHIFHTSDKDVWDYVNRFSGFNSYRHKVVAIHEGLDYTLPINLHTINKLFGQRFTPSEAAALLRSEPREVRNLEDKAISLVGTRLYKAFIQDYTIKQWGRDPKDLDASVIARLPVRLNYNTDYFSDVWQGIPTIGYTAMFQRMIESPRIEVHLSTDFDSVEVDPRCQVVYTGRLDKYFGYKHGRLKWRSVRLVTKVVDTMDFQGAYVINYSDACYPFTRIVEHRHAHPERNYGDKSVVSWEYAFDTLDDDPSYPMNLASDKETLVQYLGEKTKVIFGGRLGTYRYVDMHTSVKDALTCYYKRIKEHIC